MMQRLAASIDAHDWTGLAALLHEDFPCRLVHTSETFDRDGDRDGWVRFNADYPGFDRFTLEGCIGEHDRAAGRAHSTGWVDDELNHFEVALFITVRDGLIVDGVQVWTDSGRSSSCGLPTMRTVLGPACGRRDPGDLGSGVDNRMTVPAPDPRGT